MRRGFAVGVIVSLLWPALAFAVDARGASYFGGTAAFRDAKDPIEGTLNTNDETCLIFSSSRGVLSIPYASVVDVEYGQKAGRRVGTAIATTALLGPVGLAALFSKKRQHFLTIAFKDADGKDQVAVLELGKDIVRTTLPIVETRSGKKIVYQDKEK
jgi:hypothetical protein